MRLEITRRTDLATRALLELHDPDTQLKAAELAARLDASAGFLTQAMTPLVARGWVTSEPGPTGGYHLTGDLAGITVLDVVEAVEGSTDTTECVLQHRACSAAAPCALHDPWSKARTLLLAELGSTTLASLVGRPVRRRA